MKFAHSLSLALAISATGAPAWAAPEDGHQAHHPAAAASSVGITTMPSKTRPEMARMDTQIKAMQEMHDKMMAAKTPTERDALMAEHMKLMQDGMSMMSGVPSGGVSGMKDMKKEVAAHHQAMEARMEMMQAMMQMMMDRLPAASPK